MSDYAVTDALSQHTQTGQIPEKTGQLPPDEFMKFVEETRSQPSFRTSMDKAADYYDGNQLTPDVLAKLNAMGFGELMANLIKPAIDAVLGIEAKNRQQLRVTADDDMSQDVAEALSAKLTEAEREARLDRACSDAYAGQCKAGLGWVHVARNSDPFLYKYKCEAVHRREMYWDWATPVSDPALDTSRYLIRQKWFPTDQVAAAMPDQAPLINAAGSGWSPDWLSAATESAALQNAFDQESRMTVSAWEWRNIDNRRIALQECWYARYIRGLVLDLGSRVVEFDKTNPLHMAAVGSGRFRPTPAVYRKLRCSIWFGPHLLHDYDPGTNKLPYVPFWGFREDLTGVPYGLVRSMIPLQDEVNARRRKLMWLLSSKRVQVDSDALDKTYNDFQDLIREVSRPDAMIITNPARLNKQGGYSVESDLGLSQQQFEVLAEAKQGIQDAAGIFNSTMGKKDTGADSGLAINSLAEQSSNTLGEINDNFKFARQVAAQRLLDLVRQDLSGRAVDVVAGESEARRKKISLNTPAVDQLTGIQYRKNDVDKSAVKVALEDIPQSPAYRAQQQVMLAEIIKALPPLAQAALIPYFIEGSDLPKRHQMADAARKAMGMPVDGQDQDPQVVALQQQLQQLHQQSEEAMQHYEQAVQEQSAKATQLGQQVASLQLQVRDKGAEIALRHQELEFERSKSEAERAKLAADAAAKAAAANAEAERVRVDAAAKARELDIKERQQLIDAAKASAEHGHRQAELEHQQLLATQGAGTDTEKAEATPEQHLAHERAIVQIQVDGATEQAVKVAEINAKAKVEAAELQASKTPSTLTKGQADATSGKPAPTAPTPAPAPVSAPSAPAPAPAAPKPRARTVSIKKQPDGSYVGTVIDH